MNNSEIRAIAGFIKQFNTKTRRDMQGRSSTVQENSFSREFIFDENNDTNSVYVYTSKDLEFISSFNVTFEVRTIKYFGSRVLPTVTPQAGVSHTHDTELEVRTESSTISGFRVLVNGTYDITDALAQQHPLPSGEGIYSNFDIIKALNSQISTTDINSVEIVNTSKAQINLYANIKYVGIDR